LIAFSLHSGPQYPQTLLFFDRLFFDKSINKILDIWMSLFHQFFSTNQEEEEEAAKDTNSKSFML